MGKDVQISETERERMVRTQKSARIDPTVRGMYLFALVYRFPLSQYEITVMEEDYDRR